MRHDCYLIERCDDSMRNIRRINFPESERTFCQQRSMKPAREKDWIRAEEPNILLGQKTRRGREITITETIPIFGGAVFDGKCNEIPRKHLYFPTKSVQVSVWCQTHRCHFRMESFALLVWFDISSRKKNSIIASIKVTFYMVRGNILVT